MLSAMRVTIMMSLKKLKKPYKTANCCLFREYKNSTTVLALAPFFKAPTKLLRFRLKTQTFSRVFAGHPL